MALKYKILMPSTYEAKKLVLEVFNIMGNLIKRGKYYSVIVYVTDNMGNKKQKWISTKCEKKSDAQKALVKILQEIENGEFVISDKILFYDFAKEWLNTIAKNKVELNTFESYKMTMNTHILPYFERWNLYLSDVKPIHIQKYCNEKIEKISPNTIRKHMAILSGIFNYALKMDLVKSNVVERVELPKKTAFHGNFFNTDQLKYILMKVQGTPIETIIILSAYFGLRRSEALGLKWSDIDFENNLVHIRRSRVIAGNTIIDKATKTEKSTRVLPLMPVVKAYLTDLKKKRKNLDQHEEFFSEYLCCAADGKPMRPDYVTKTFKKIIHELNIPDNYRFHDLRHTVATVLMKNNLDIQSIGTWLGHNNIRTTLHYTHSDLEAQKLMSDVLNDFLD